MQDVPVKSLPHPLPKKLNVGCGYDIRPGWLNVDNGNWHDPDYVADITDLPMLPAGHFDEILAQDILEHIARNKQVSTLAEWRRLLDFKGILRVRVPSLYDMAMLSKHPDFQSEERQLYLINMVYGTQAYPGDYHLCGYTAWTMAAEGRSAGLEVSEARLKDHWLYDVTFRRAEELDDFSDAEFVHWCYFNLLRRCVDDGGFAYWRAEVAAGRDRASVKSAIAAAGE